MLHYIHDLWTLDPCASDSVLKHLKGKRWPLIDAIGSCENTVRHVLLQIRRSRKRRVEVLCTLLRVVINVIGHSNEVFLWCTFKYHTAMMCFFERLSPYLPTRSPSRAAAKRLFYSRRQAGVNCLSSTSAGQIASSHWPRKLLASWTGCCMFDVMLCNLLPLTNFPTD